MKIIKCVYCSKSKFEPVTHRLDNVGIIRCLSCKVMMVDEISDDTEGLYTADYFEKDSDTKSGYTDYLSSPAVNVLGKFGLSRQFIGKNGSHLDLGSADGKLMELFRANGYRTTGLEISQDAVDIANAKGLRMLQSNLHTFPDGLEKFDVITAFDLLEHADRPGLVLDHTIESLAKNGFFVFSTLAVTKEDPSDYWFNHSLEHYVYYDDKSLHNILSEKFGNNYAFTRIEVHGVSEFWGIAKNGALRDSERAVIDNIAKDSFDISDPEKSYYLTLFYNQLSKFSTSQRIIKKLAKTWKPETLLMAKFYNAFYQGKFEEALATVRSSGVRVSLWDSPYWQALSYIHEQYAKIKQDDLVRTSEAQKNTLERKVFAYKMIASSINRQLQENINRQNHDERPVHRKLASKLKRRIKSAVRGDDDVGSPVNLRDKKPAVLITMPWMTFGGAETLVYNYCREVKDEFDISFMTGLESLNEWEYKFREISDMIYHLPGMVDDPAQYIEFISGYIDHAGIDVLHLVHNGFMFDMLPELRRRHPDLKVVLTLFNDRVPQYVDGAVTYQDYIDGYVTDNNAVAVSVGAKIGGGSRFTVIPNGINTDVEFNPSKFDRKKERESLGLNDDELAVFFIGRLSPEKNPDVFVDVASRVSQLPIRFFIVGDGPMRTEVESVITRKKLTNVTMLGYQRDVAHYMSAGDVMVLPSSIEGFPLSVLEGMASKLSVIASNVGAIPDIISDGSDGYIVKAGSAMEIADTIKSLQKNRTQLENVKVAAREKVTDRYSNIILKNNYLSLYRDIL